MIVQLTTQTWSKLCNLALAKSRDVIRLIDRHLPKIIAAWAVLVAIMGATKLVRLHQAMDRPLPLAVILPLAAIYLLIALTPLAAWQIVSSAFSTEKSLSRPSFSMAVAGTWQRLTRAEALRRDGYGIEGFLASLVAGIVLSIFVRLGQYALAMPAIPMQGPDWAVALFTAMTADLLIMTFLYSTCLAMALRGAPLFPRMLLYTWLYDICMQLGIARYAMSVASMPAEIGPAMQPFLDGNIKKVLISVAIWLPYLLLSKRINLTFRHRVAMA